MYDNFAVESSKKSPTTSTNMLLKIYTANCKIITTAFKVQKVKHMARLSK